MKKLLLSLFVLQLFVSADAQLVSLEYPESYEYQQWYSGQVVTVEGETITGEIQWLNRQYNQRRVNFRNAGGEKIYKNTELKSYTINGQKYQFIDHKDYGKRYAAVVTEGGINIYNYYMLKSEASIKATNTVTYDENGRAINNIEFTRERKDEDFENYIMAIKHDKPKMIQIGSPTFMMNFKKNMSEYVSDYPELAAKIKNKEKGYKMLARDKIIIEYNKWYAEKK